MARFLKTLLALACALPVAATALAEEPASELSLVAVGAVSTIPYPQSACGEGAVCDPISWGAFEGARTLAGPDFDPHFGASIVVHLPVHDEPMLVVVRPLGGGQYHIAARGRWNAETGMACIDRRELDALGFHPAGEGIVETAPGTCAKVARLRELFESAVPLEAISAKQIEELAGPTPASGAPHFTLQNRGEGSGPVVLAEIRLERGYPNGDSWCPADTNWETDICLGASIVLHKGRVARKLGADAGADPAYERGRFKQIGGHSVRYVEGGRRIAFIEQTDEDYWYLQWGTPVEKGRFCLPADVIEHFGVQSDLAFAAGENGARCYSLRDAKRR